MSKVTNTEPSELLTVSEVANILRVDDTTVRRWIKNGVLSAITLPHAHKRQAYRVRKGTIDGLLSETSETKHTHHSHNHHDKELEAVGV